MLGKVFFLFNLSRKQLNFYSTILIKVNLCSVENTLQKRGKVSDYSFFELL